MTCQDCIHYKSIGTLCDKYIYPEERNNEPCDYFEKKQMTCQDCKYYHPTIDTEGKCKTDTDKYYGFDTTVDGTTERDCPSFMPIEDSWESVSK